MDKQSQRDITRKLKILTYALEHKMWLKPAVPPVLAAQRFYR